MIGREMNSRITGEKLGNAREHPAAWEQIM